MAKTKDKRKNPAPKDSTAQVEEKLVQISTDVAKAAKDYRVPLIVGLVVVVSIIGLFALVNSFKERAKLTTNNKFEALMLGTDDAIRADYAQFLESVKGDPFEAYAVARVCGWMLTDDTTENRNQALTLAQDALTRHNDAPGLKGIVSRLTEAKNDDANFVVPGPPLVVNEPASVESFTSPPGTTPNLTPPKSTGNFVPNAPTNEAHETPTSKPAAGSTPKNIETEGSSTPQDASAPNAAGTPKTESTPAAGSQPNNGG